MKTYGPNLGMPHTKAMGDGLFELRLKGKEGIARVFYCAIINHEIIMLHMIIKKQQKTASQELRLAKKRLKEVKSNAKKITCWALVVRVISDMFLAHATPFCDRIKLCSIFTNKIY